MAPGSRVAEWRARGVECDQPLDVTSVETLDWELAYVRTCRWDERSIKDRPEPKGSQVTTPLTSRRHTAEDGLQVAHSDADDPAAAAEGRQFSCCDTAAEGGDADAKHLGGLRH